VHARSLPDLWSGRFVRPAGPESSVPLRRRCCLEASRQGARATPGLDRRAALKLGHELERWHSATGQDGGGGDDPALFDFDGTVTFADTFTPFILGAVSPARLAFGKLALSPLVLAYKVNLLSVSRLRRSIVRFGFQGRRYAEVQAAGTEYSRGPLARAVRAEALQRIGWHQARGDVVVIVSASLDVYLSPWCRALGVELICSELEERRGVLTGGYRNGDCSGDEKARRVRERHDLKRFRTIYAYGDTHEDDAMLALAHRRFYRWRELRDEPSL
jgi:phosphatidylglycerophosphatase C